MLAGDGRRMFRGWEWSGGLRSVHGNQPTEQCDGYSSDYKT